MFIALNWALEHMWKCHGVAILTGHSGDYLVQYKVGDYGIVQKEKFSKTYIAIPNEKSNYWVCWFGTNVPSKHEYEFNLIATKYIILV